MFTKILLAYDGSDHAKRALSTAAAVAKAFGAELHLSHAPQIETPPIVVGSFVGALDIPPTDEQVAEAGEHIANEVAGLAEGLGVSLAGRHVGRGDAATYTLKVADEIGADLIVMGRRGLGAFGALALGSVSQDIAHGAKCACMTVV